MTADDDRARDIAANVLHLMEQQQRAAAAAATPAIGEPAPLYSSTQAEEGKAIYASGEFIEYCKKTFGKVWYGDAHILEGVLYIAANMRVLNATDGIHLHVSGTTQSGKSDSVKSAMRFIHPKDRLIKTFSLKYLFYADHDLHPNTIIFSDDTQFEPETAALYRNILTSWFTGVTRGTVINHVGKDLHIPPRVSMILTSVESVVLDTDEGQDESRFLTIEIRRDKETMLKIRKFIQEAPLDISNELSVIYSVWGSLTPSNVTIHEKYENDIPLRDFKRYLTLVQAHALLCNRTRTTKEDFIAIDKFLSYSKPMLDSVTPAHRRDEKIVLDTLTHAWQNTDEIQTNTKLSLQRVYRALRGWNGSFERPAGGLMGSVRNLKIEYSTTTRKHSFKLE